MIVAYIVFHFLFQDLQKRLGHLKESIFTWDYFVNWKKVKSNVKEIEKELNLLNYLIGKDNIEKEFLKLIREYPKLKKTFPILITVRENKLKDMKIISDLENLKYTKVYSFFCDNMLSNSDEMLLNFFNYSGLKDIFKDKTIKNLVDYCLGVEVGLDTNARKNRTGILMENLIDKYLKEFTKRENLEFTAQATRARLKSKWNCNLLVDRSNRFFDFAVYDKNSKRLFLIETNYYGGGGSKLKATAGEYKDLFNFLKEQDIEFIWITDGFGWQTSKNPLLETFTNNDYVFNLDLLNKGVLEEIICC